jgi:uncharacterized coiled-coil protein SlyX
MNVEKMMPDEERLIVMETKLATQEDLVDVLNQTVYRQQKKSTNSSRSVLRLPSEWPGCRQTMRATCLPMKDRRTIDI